MPFSRNGSYRSQTATGSTSGCLRNVAQSCLPRPPLPISPMRTRSFAPITRLALKAPMAPIAKVRRFIRSPLTRAQAGPIESGGLQPAIPDIENAGELLLPPGAGRGDVFARIRFHRCRARDVRRDA